MAIDAIGSVLSSNSTSALNNATLNQDDFIKLFLSELNFQDPMTPVDNKEFLSQMTQFSNIEQARKTAESIQNLVLLNSTQQSVGLLGRTVEAATDAGAFAGKVIAVNFDSDGTGLTIKASNGSVFTGIKMSQIGVVQP